MHEKMKTSYARYLKKLRQSTVEPVLGTLIEYGGLKKGRTKGINQADKCMLMAATAYNIKKWLRYTQRKVETSAMALKGDFNWVTRLTRYYFISIKLYYTNMLFSERKWVENHI